jgi:hydrogenase nickel incorporation protein HypA/HybF
MHEMSIAMNLIDIAVEQAREAGSRQINRLDVEIGSLAGIEISSLSFCYESARKGTLCAGAELAIHEIPGLGRCPDCATETAFDFFVALCPACGSGLEIIQGRELRLKSLNVD